MLAPDSRIPQHEPHLAHQLLPTLAESYFDVKKWNLLAAHLPTIK
jgi:hypothetical protein